MYIQYEDGRFEEVYLPPTGDTLPVGSVSAYAGETVPTNWLECNGQEVSRTEYAELFKAIGTTYGAGDSSTTFNLPDITERVIVGHLGDGEFSLGNIGGEKEHKLTVDEMPSHKHNINYAGSGTGIQGAVPGGNNNLGPNGNFISNAGGGQAHNNMQPYIALNYIIKAKQSVGIVGAVTNDINDQNENAVVNAKTTKDYVDNGSKSYMVGYLSSTQNISKGDSFTFNMQESESLGDYFELDKSNKAIKVLKDCVAIISGSIFVDGSLGEGYVMSKLMINDSASVVTLERIMNKDYTVTSIPSKAVSLKKNDTLQIKVDYTSDSGNPSIRSAKNTSFLSVLKI